MNVSINEFFNMLSWDAEEDMQSTAKEIAREIKYLSILFQPIESKSIWHNCAKILVEKTDDELYKYRTKLFEWLKDMNWPGAEIIYDRLFDMSADFIRESFTKCLENALKTDDKPWVSSLKDFGQKKGLL